MKELLLKQLQTYSNAVNSLQQELIELDKTMREKSTLLEQNKGAYNAIITMAIENGVIDHSGKIIDNDITVSDEINDTETIVDIEE